MPLARGGKGKGIGGIAGGGFKGAGGGVGGAAAAIIMEIIAKGADLVGQALQLAAFRINKASEIAALKIRGDQQNAETAEIEKKWETRERILDMIPLTETLGIKNIVSGMKEVEVARSKEFQIARDALRDRSAQLAPFSPELTRQRATGEVNQIKRDMGEAAIIGGQLAGVEAQQQQLDRINQQISILDRMSEATQQANRLNQKIAEQTEKLNEKMAGLPDDLKRKLKELEEQAKDPLKQLKEAGGFKKPFEREVRPAAQSDARPPFLRSRDDSDL